MEIKKIKTKSEFHKAKIIWQKTGIENPERGDSFEVLVSTFKYGGVLYGLYDADNLIATAWLTDDGRRMYLHHFAIDPLYQNKKLSHLLMEKIINIASENKRQIKLEVNENNKIAIALYKKYDFTELGDYKVLINRKTGL